VFPKTYGGWKRLGESKGDLSNMQLKYTRMLAYFSSASSSPTKDNYSIDLKFKPATIFLSLLKCTVHLASEYIRYPNLYVSFCQVVYILILK